MIYLKPSNLAALIRVTTWLSLCHLTIFLRDPLSFFKSQAGNLNKDMQDIFLFANFGTFKVTLISTNFP